MIWNVKERMAEAERVRQERLNKAKRDREEIETANCTFKPEVRKCPSYVSRMARGSRSARAAVGAEIDRGLQYAEAQRRTSRQINGALRRRYHSSMQDLFNEIGPGSRGYTHSTTGGPVTSRNYASDNARPQWK